MAEKRSSREKERPSDALFDKLLSPGGSQPPEVSVVFTRLISPNPRQPRKEIDPDSFELLLASIAAKGIQQPLLVRPVGRGYELVAGQRRLLAAQRLELAEVPVVVRELSDNEALEAAIIENLTREDLNPVDETDSILNLLSLELGKPVGEMLTLLYRLQRTSRTSAHNVMGGSTGDGEKALVERVFTGLGKMTWASFVQNRLPILSYPPELLEAVRSGGISYTKAKELAKISDPSLRESILKQVQRESLSVAEVRKMVSAVLSSGTGEPEYAKDLRDLRRQLSPERIGRLDARKRRQLDTLLEKLRTLLAAD